MPLDDDAENPALGPAFVLAAAALSFGASWVWKCDIGEAACKWQQSYSPKRTAFKIWFLVYALTGASCVAQLTGRVLVLDGWTSALWAFALAFTAGWPPLFSDSNSVDALHAAAGQLFVATAATLLALANECAWQSDESRAELALLTAPLSLLAGWLVVATALGIGIAEDAAANPSGRPECAGYKYKSRDDRQQLFADFPRRGTWVPSLVCLAVSLLSIALQDPVLLAPVAWFVLMQTKLLTSSYCVTLLLVVCVAVGVVVMGSVG